MQRRRIRPMILGFSLLVALGLPASTLAVSTRSAVQTPAPVGPAIAGDTVLFSDNFDQPGRVLGQSDGWTVTTAPNGSAGIVSGHTGSGARLTEPDYVSTSIAYMRHTLATPVQAVSEVGWFNETFGGCDPNAGYSQGDVPFIRFFDNTGKRVAGLYRINGTGTCADNAKLYVEYGGTFNRVNKNIQVGQWNKMELRITTGAPGAGLVQVYLNDSKVYEVTNANNGSLGIASVTSHNEHPHQKGELLVDDIVVATFGSGPPPTQCDPAGPTPATSDPGTTVVADGFDSNDFSKWSRVNVGADGTATLQTTTVHTPTCAARLHETATAGSRANIQKDVATSEIYADGWFNVTAEGPSTSNVPEFRLFNGTTRVLSVYRVNVGGNLYLSVPNGTGGTSFISLGQARALNTWFHVNVHAIANGSTSTVVVTVDGVQRYSSTAVPLGQTAFTSILCGNEVSGQTGDLNIDDVVIKTVP